MCGIVAQSGLVLRHRNTTGGCECHTAVPHEFWMTAFFFFHALGKMGEEGREGARRGKKERGNEEEIKKRKEKKRKIIKKKTEGPPSNRLAMTQALFFVSR